MASLKYCEAIATDGRSYSWENLHNCIRCPYFTTSLFLMTNHVRRHHSSVEKFACDNAKIEVYYCQDCRFKTKLTVLFKQHLDRYHGLKMSIDDLSSENFCIQNYVCEKCEFETNFSLKWLQHTSTCTGNKENL